MTAARSAVKVAPSTPMPEPLDVRRVLREAPQFGQAEIQSLRSILNTPQLTELRQELQGLEEAMSATSKPDPKAHARAGVVAYLLGKHSLARTYLAEAPADPVAAFHLGIVLLGAGEYAAAEAQFDVAAKAGYDAIECRLRKAETIRAQGRLEEAEKLVRGGGTEAASRPEYSFQMGCILSDRGDPYGAIEYLERAVDMDPHHTRALFWLAGENALRGNDQEAIRLYERALSRPPFYVGAMLNLGLLYEDQQNYPAAAFCFRRVLDQDPTHLQARLYLRDIEATNDMYYDEESARNEARLQQLLARPITDFELSVRARNCLQAMDIFTLGDLTRVSEGDLLAGKNFGETSLSEIRDMMSAHGLRIGQNINLVAPAAAASPLFNTTLSPQEQAVLAKPIGDLNLSVRARKCMSRLGLTSVGELVQRTADELLSSRNFGVTSLNEIRAKLAEMGLSLRNE